MYGGRALKGELCNKVCMYVCIKDTFYCPTRDGFERERSQLCRQNFPELAKVNVLGG